MRAIPIVILLVVHAAAAKAQPPVAALLERASVDRATYTLLDLVAVEDAQADTWAALSDLAIGRSPRPGYSADITREEIEGRLRRLAPAFQVRLTGAERVRVSAVGQNYSGVAVVNAVTRELEASLPQRFDRWKLAAVGTIRDLTLPPGPVSLRLADPDSVQPGKRRPVWVEIRVKDELVRRLPVWVSVSAWQPVLVARGALAPGVLLTHQNTVSAWRDLAEISGPALTELADGEPIRLRRSLDDGAVLTSHLVEDVPAISEGQLVTVVATAGPIRLETNALALRDAGVDEEVALRNPTSGEAYRGRVIERGVVLVQ